MRATEVSSTGRKVIPPETVFGAATGTEKEAAEPDTVLLSHLSIWLLPFPSHSFDAQRVYPLHEKSEELEDRRIPAVRTAGKRRAPDSRQARRQET